MFVQFRERRKMQSKISLGWMILEFPLAFGILLLQASMSVSLRSYFNRLPGFVCPATHRRLPQNVVQTVAYSNALYLVLGTMIDAGFNLNGTVTPASDFDLYENKTITRYLNKLQVTPNVVYEINYISNLQNSTTPIRKLKSFLY